mmetsp:Transcript_25812/g.74325  ORF Transcript_25812/g.74325 Transcript_25812/m.74325 type:complete len:202 (-) Transcript_25812:242-847(-)
MRVRRSGGHVLTTGASPNVLLGGVLRAARLELGAAARALATTRRSRGDRAVKRHLLRQAWRVGNPLGNPLVGNATAAVMPLLAGCATMTLAPGSVMPALGLRHGGRRFAEAVEQLPASRPMVDATIDAELQALFEAPLHGLEPRGYVRGKGLNVDAGPLNRGAFASVVMTSLLAPLRVGGNFRTLRGLHRHCVLAAAFWLV